MELVGVDASKLRPDDDTTIRLQEAQQQHLADLYAEARKLHQARKWDTVVDMLDRISGEDPSYPDPDGLRASAVEASERQRHLVALYAKGLRHKAAEEWGEALGVFEEIERLEPGYGETRALLAQIRQRAAERNTLAEEAGPTTRSSQAEESIAELQQASPSGVKETGGLANLVEARGADSAPAIKAASPRWSISDIRAFAVFAVIGSLEILLTWVPTIYFDVHSGGWWWFWVWLGVLPIGGLQVLYGVRKPGAGLLGGVVTMAAGTIPFLGYVGISYVDFPWWWFLLVGGNSELIFLATQYQRFDTKTMVLAGGFGNAIFITVSLTVFGLLGTAHLAEGLLVLFLVGIGGGLLSKSIGDASASLVRSASNPH